MSRHQFYSRNRYQYSCGTTDDDEEESDENEHQDHDYDMPSMRSKKYINKGRWTKDEDDKLKKVVEAQGSHDWRAIAGYFSDRSDVQCQHRWHKVLNPELVKGPWTKEEDDKVLQLVHQFGPKRWTLIAKHLKGRTGKQCRERWHNHLNPDIKKTAWTEEEDRLIYQLHKKMGNRWAEIAKYLPGRTDNAIKNHWNSTMRRKFEAEEEAKRRSMPGHNAYTPSTSSLQGLQPVRLFANAYNSSGIQQTGGSLIVHGAAGSGYQTPGQSLVKCVLPSDGSGNVASNVADEDLISPLKGHGIKDLVDQMTASGTFGDMTTFELLSGTQINTGVTPIKFTGLNKKGATGYRFDGYALASLKDGSGGLIPITSPATSKLTTPPILRKSKRRKKTHQTHQPAIKKEVEEDTKPVVIKQETSTPVKNTPIKALPFSPSQFFNEGNEKMTSTPVCTTKNSTPIQGIPMDSFPIKTELGVSEKEIKGHFRTPRIRRSLMDATPRTPTPFKNALAELEKKSGPIQHMTPETPSHFMDDINDVIQKDTGSDFYQTDVNAFKRKVVNKENESPSKKARKSLEQTWSTPGEIPLPFGTDNLMLMPETPSKSLLADSSIVFSPPSILKETLHMDSLNDAFALPKSPVPVQKNKDKSRAYLKKLRFGGETPCKSFGKINVAWETVACGKTQDQVELTEKARQLLLNKGMELRPRSLVL